MVILGRYCRVGCKLWKAPLQSGNTLHTCSQYHHVVVPWSPLLARPLCSCRLRDAAGGRPGRAGQPVAPSTPPPQGAAAAGGKASSLPLAGPARPPPNTQNRLHSNQRQGASGQTIRLHYSRTSVNPHTMKATLWGYRYSWSGQQYIQFYPQFAEWKDRLQDEIMKSKIVIYNNFTASAAERRGAVADLVSGLELVAAGPSLLSPVLVVAGNH